MLRRLEKLRGFTLQATDGEIGRIDDFYFDDQVWRVRYMIVETGPWLFGRKVMISPVAIDQIRWEERTVPVSLTREEVEDSPELDHQLPVSQEQESQLTDYYGWPAYWTGGTVTGGLRIPAAPATLPPGGEPRTAEEAKTNLGKDRVQEEVEAAIDRGENHLRSVDEVTGYDIMATDGEIGHLDDLFASEKDWTIRYALVDTRDWLPGRKVLIMPDWIRNIDWSDRDVYINKDRQAVEESPEYDDSQPLGRSYEEKYRNHYDAPYYWTSP